MLHRAYFLLAGLVCCTAGVAAERKPNVLLIVADDLGYHDVGFQGCPEIPTPHLDKLAAQGVRCTNGYVTHSFCSPSRAALLTGRYQHRFGHENNPAWLPESTWDGLPVDQITLPQVLQQAGYTTAHVGKWHLGAHPQFHPLQRGFDESFAALGGGHTYFLGADGPPEYQIPLNRNGVNEAQEGYLTDQFGDEAAAFVRRQAESQKPWMLYLAFTAPHTRLQAPQERIDQFKHLPDLNRRIYAAMVSVMDDNIGKVMATLATTGQSDRTIVIFFSDNGGPHLAGKGMTDFADNSPLRGAKGSVYEGGIRVPFLVSWPAKLKPGVYEQPVIALDVFATAVAQAAAAMPSDRPMDGVNLIPYLSGENAAAPHEMLFWRSQGPGGLYAARSGPWKYVALPGRGPELYHVADDVGETQNLAAAKPEVVSKLRAAVANWENGTIAPIFGGRTQGTPKTKDKEKAD